MTGVDEYKVLANRGGGWSIIARSNDRETAIKIWNKFREENPDLLSGVNVTPVRGVAYMIRRSDWEMR